MWSIYYTLSGEVVNQNVKNNMPQRCVNMTNDTNNILHLTFSFSSDNTFIDLYKNNPVRVLNFVSVTSVLRYQTQC